MGELPIPRAPIAQFKQVIGWHDLEKQQERLELDARGQVQRDPTAPA
jgi:hypothetical protein